MVKITISEQFKWDFISNLKLFTDFFKRNIHEVLKSLHTNLEWKVLKAEIPWSMLCWCFQKKKKKIIVIYWIGLLWLLKSALQYLEHVRFFLFWFGMEQLLVANGGYYLFKFWVEGFWTLLNFTALEGSALLKKSVTCRSFTLRDGLVGRIVTMVLSWLESHINSLELKRY